MKRIDGLVATTVHTNGSWDRGDADKEKGELVKESHQKVLEHYRAAFAAFIEKQNR